MTLSLELGTVPDGLSVRSSLMGNFIELGEYQISMKDFLIATHYVLTNSDLEPDDPRLQFVRCVHSMREVDGYNPGGKRLEASEPPVLPKKS